MDVPCGAPTGPSWGKKRKRSVRKARQYPGLTKPGEKVQIDVKEVPYHCLKGAAERDGKHLYQWTAIDGCTRFRCVYGYEEHTPESSVDFLGRLLKAFPFPIQIVQMSNSTEFAYRLISDKELCPFEEVLAARDIAHKLIPPRMPWHNGKVERSRRSDQRYLYDWETFSDVQELNRQLRFHLSWYNNRPMRSLGWCSPLQRLTSLVGSHH